MKDAVRRFADEPRRDETLELINEVDHKIAVTNEAVNDSVKNVAQLLKAAPAIPVTDSIKQRVTDRALAHKAPFHRSKNSVGDAILIEIYSDFVNANRGQAHAFVTHNTKDFSELSGDHRKPHSDLAPLFDSEASTYWVTIVELINWLDPELLPNLDFEFNYSQPSRRLSEILEAEHRLFLQVWYNRHWNLRIEIEEGRHHVVPEKDYSRTPYRQDQTLDTVWAKALEAAKRTEEELGPDNIGPWSDFEWGMINGKLSALRWVLGEEWDFLDT